MVKRLVDGGANPLGASAESRQYRFSIQAYESGRSRHEAIARAFMDAGLPMTLTKAVHYGWTADVRRILGEGPPAEGISIDLIYLALGSGKPEILQLLLDARAQAGAESTTAHGGSLANEKGIVEYAAQTAGGQAATALIEAGAPVDPLASGWEMIPGLRVLPPGRYFAEHGNLLDAAVDQGDGAFFDALVAHGMSPVLRQESHASGMRARSALHDRVMRAAWRGHQGILDRLFEAAADLDLSLLVDEPLLAAAAAGHVELYDALRHDAEPRTIHAAAALGRDNEIRSLLVEHRGDPFQKDVRCGASPLAWAVLFGHADTAKLLLESGADPNEWMCSGVARAIWEGAVGTEMPAQRDRKDSVLAVAVRKRSWATAKRLVEAGARVDRAALRALVGDAAPEATELLMVAAERSQVETDMGDWAYGAIQVLLRTHAPEEVALARLGMLLDAGAATSFRDTKGDSILTAAMGRQLHPKAIIALRDAGAPVPPEVAVACGWVSPAEGTRLLADFDEQALRHLIHQASSMPGIGPTRRILEARHDISEEVILDRIRGAAGEGRLDLLDLLLTRAPAGYDYLTDGDVLARSAGHPGLLRALLERGADPHRRPSSGLGPVAVAAMSSRPESIRWLLAAGVAPDTPSSQGNTPLSLIYAEVGDARRPEQEDLVVECVELLLEAGADPLRVDSVGRVAFRRLLSHASTESMDAKLRAIFLPYVGAAWL